MIPSSEVHKSTLGGKTDLDIYCVYSVSGAIQGLSHLAFDLILTIIKDTPFIFVL